MAQVEDLPGGRRRVRFYDHNRIRRAIALGKVPRRTADMAADHIEGLVNAKRGGYQAEGAHAAWAGKQLAAVKKSLIRYGLIPPDAAGEPPQATKLAPTIEAWFEQYIVNRPGSDGSRKVWRRSKNLAVKFFGRNKRIDAITTGDALDWFESMQRGSGKLAPTTARKMVGVARQVFKRALKSKLITENPFVDDELPTSIASRDKDYVDVRTIESVLRILPSAEWRAVIRFARFAGMRVQSELPLLKWVDVDEQENCFSVYSPKTKRTRRVPLFPEIRRHSMTCDRSQGIPNSSCDHCGRSRTTGGRHSRRC